MQRRIILTADGSHTVEVPDMQVTYHSRHGAVQESMHVFLRAGLDEARQRFPGEELAVFETGFGSGLNALLTAMEAGKAPLRILYTAVEAFPLNAEEVRLLNYGKELGEEDLFGKLHDAPWDEEAVIHSAFTLLKVRGRLQDFTPGHRFHLVYYDAFAPSAQPELWTEAIFRQLYGMLHPDGILTTYCSKGDVRRALQAAGFIVTKLPGPPGKREMVRANR